MVQHPAGLRAPGPAEVDDGAMVVVRRRREGCAPQSFRETAKGLTCRDGTLILAPALSGT